VGGRARDVLYRGLSNLGRFAEAAAFLPQDLIDRVFGNGSDDLSVEGRGKRGDRTTGSHVPANIAREANSTTNISAAKEETV
jgi:hypothetical protein